MTTAIPSIACLGVIGRNNNPLHISIFPSHDPTTNTFTPIRNPLQFSLLLSSTIDIFNLHAATATSTSTNLSGDLGLLHAVDDRLSAYGFETNTGIRLICVVDARGRRVDAANAGKLGVVGGLRESELKVVFRAMQGAWVRLSQNPFFELDRHVPMDGGGGVKIRSKRFEADMRRIGEGWTPGVTSL